MNVHRFCAAILIAAGLLVTQSSAQVHIVVDSGGAQFMDGAKVMGSVAQGAEIYVLRKKGNWYQVVEPNSKKRAWVNKSKVRPRVYTNAQLADFNRLNKKEDRFLEYVDANSATTAQMNETIQWANQLRALMGDRHPAVANAVSLAGLVAVNNQAYGLAKTWFNDAMQIHLNVYGKDSPMTAQTYLDMANLHNKTGDYTDTIKQAAIATKIYRAAVGNDHTTVARSLFPAGIALSAIGEHEVALKYFQDSYRIFRKERGESDIATLQLRSLVASQMVELDRNQDAAREYQAIVSLFEKDHPDERGDIAKYRIKLAKAKLDLSDPASIGSFRESVQTLLRDFPEHARYIQSARKKMIAMMLASGDVNGAFGEIYSMLKRLRYTIRKELWGLTPEQQLGQLEHSERYFFHKSVSLARDFSAVQSVVDMSAEWMINAKGLLQEAQSVEATFGQDFNRRDAWANEDLVKLAQLKNAIPKGAAYVDIMKFRAFEYREDLTTKMTIDRYAAWVTPSKGDVRFLDLGPADAIDQAIKNLQSKLIEDSENIKDLKDERDTPAIKKLLQSVSDLVWKPILAKTGGAKALIISPDQATWLIPWAALLNEDGSYAIESHQFQLSLSGREFIQPRVKGNANPPIIFANPEFGAQKQRPASSNRQVLKAPLVGPLEYSAYEASVIKAPLEKLTGANARVLMDRDALESEFKRLNGPEVLVVSTHGFSQNAGGGEGTRSANSQANPNFEFGMSINPLLQCGLMLAGANQHRSIDSLDNDGVLTGVEIASTNLRGTQLAVLSACRTGLGELQSTGGVVGLRRAFHVAGANSVLASLWDVPDQSTANLIENLFRDLTTSRDVATALQNAQKDRIKRRRNKFGAAHPVFWAAFTLSGNGNF